MSLIVAAKNCRRSTDTSYDYIGFGYSYLHSAEYSSRINSTLSANMDIFVRSDEYRLPLFIYIGNYTRGSSFFWLFFRIANSMRLDYHIFVLVLVIIKLTKVRNLKIFILFSDFLFSNELQFTCTYNQKGLCESRIF